MTRPDNVGRVLDAFLAPEHDRLPDRVLEAALDDIARTPQRRALRVPWRFQSMAALTRTTGIAAVALLAAIGVGGLIYTNARTPGVGSTPTPTPASTAGDVAKGIHAWARYTSMQYGYQVAYPSDWRVYGLATREWRPSDGTDSATQYPYADVFEGGDEDSIGLWVWEMPLKAGDDAASFEGLGAWAEAFCKATPGLRDDDLASCDGYAEHGIQMCSIVGSEPCRPAILVPETGGVAAYFKSPGGAAGAPGRVRIVQIGRPDGYPGAARYGGSIQLMQAILAEMGVGPR